MTAHVRPAARRQRWRRRKGAIFASLAAVALLLGVMVVTALIVSTGVNGWQLVAMHATARTGLALSLRSMDVSQSFDGRRTFPFVTAAQVESNSQAAALGMQQGDALPHLLGRPVFSSSDVWQLVENMPADAVVLPLAWVPKAETLIGQLKADAIPGQAGRFVTTVSKVTPGSPAEQAGLQADDVLKSAGGIPIEGTRQAWQAIVIAAQRGQSPVTLTVERAGQTLELALQAERRGELPLSRNAWDAVVEFVTHLDEPRYPEHAGLASAVLGSIYVVLVTALIAVPLGLGAAIYLEEYASRNALTEVLQVVIANLAGIPSVVYGIIGLEILARVLNLGRSILAGGLTLGLLILPIMIIAAREALRAVPPWVREAAYGVGATRWQVVRHHVLPYALPGVLTGMILSLSRGIGEAAPLILLGAFLFVTYLPSSLMDTFTIVPLQIFSWATKPQPGFNTIAAAAIIVLLAMLLLMNAVAIWLRNRYQKRW